LECGKYGKEVKEMLEAVRRIGRSISNDGDRDFISNLVEYDIVNTEKDKEKPLILVINFNTIEDTIELEPKVLDNKRLDEYLWIGNTKGNLPQDRLTTDGLKYLLSDSLVNLYNELKECELKEILKGILDNFFVTIRFRDRDVRILDLRKINFLKTNSEFTLPKEKNEYDSYKDFVKNLKALYEKTFFDIVKKYLGFDKKDIALFSITFDGKPPSLLPDYREYIEEKIIEESFEDGFEGICHTCGKKDIVTYNTARLPAKFYITDKITFSSRLEKKGFSRNFVLCKDCYRDIITGIKYIQNNLYGELAGSDLWIIPGLFFNPMGEELTEEWAEYSMRLTTSTFTIDNFLEFERKVEEELEKYRKYEELIDYSFVDFLFYKKDNQAFKIKELIKDIPLRRVESIREAIKDIQKLGDDIFGEDRGWFIGLNDIYYLMPIRKKKDPTTKKILYYNKKLLDLYKDIFLTHMVDRRDLIDDFVELIGIYRFEKFAQYNIRPPQGNVELSMVFAILKTNLLLKLFERLGMLTGGESMSESFKEILDKDIENYMVKMGYSEEESALFLLGYLIGEIGNEQIRGAESHTKKPILNKINFNGISAKNLINLSNEIFEKLDQYRIRGYNEKVYSIMKELMDKHIRSWSLSDAENVYYIMSGYAYNTYRRIRNIRKEEKSNE
jgi:CRISPR-associated protein Csh1